MTNEKSWVLDPFAGVGSTMIASIKNNRNVIGIEQEKKYVDITKQRIDKLLKGKLKIRPITQPIHIPSLNDKVAILPQEWLSLKFNGNNK